MAAACAPSAQDARDLDSATHPLDTTETGAALLRFVNHPTTSYEILDVEVGLDRRAAESIITRRSGSDAELGTPDDIIFVGVGEIDALPWVGPAAIDLLVDYALTADWEARADSIGRWDGVDFTSDQARATLDLANIATGRYLKGTVGIDPRGVESILQARPIPSIDRLASLYYVGGSALERMRDHASGRRAAGECLGVADCDPELACLGVPVDSSTPFGRCRDATILIGEGDLCSDELACGADLVCAGTTLPNDGWCVPAWMQTQRSADMSESIPVFERVDIEVPMSGLGKYAVDIIVTLDVDHPYLEDIEAFLVSPEGISLPIWETDGERTARVEVGTTNTEPLANGIWTLDIANRNDRAKGWLQNWSLELVTDGR